MLFSILIYLWVLYFQIRRIRAHYQYTVQLADIGIAVRVPFFLFPSDNLCSPVRASTRIKKVTRHIFFVGRYIQKMIITAISILERARDQVL